MTATLRLIPLSREECRTRLEQKGKTSLDDPGGLYSSSSTAEEYNQPRNPLTLKLCKNTDDIIEVDDDQTDIIISPEVVRYASLYQDGSTAAIVSLGRNYTTGIRWTPVSRALCDVSLTRSSSSGVKKKKACMVDLSTSPGGLKTDTSSTSEESQSDDGQKSQLLDPPDNANGVNYDKVVAAAFLSMRKPAGKHTVFLDGDKVDKPLGREVPLPHGSIISLYGPTGFAYEVMISQKDKNSTDSDVCDSNGSPNKKRKANPPTIEMKESPIKKPQQSMPHHDLRQRAHKNMICECTCAMCMDILVKSTFAYPCMHAFCEECSHSVTNASSASTTTATTRTNKGTCPTCRGKVEGWGAARSFDTIVWATALQGCFERDDAEDYLKRRELCGEGSPTVLERECILNDGAVGEKGGTNGLESGMNLYLPPHPSLERPATNFIRTLPPLFATTSNNVNSNNMNNGGSQNLGKSVDDVICID